ncbi:Ferredoxin [Sporobacter termitidis DSM 10068]|uniref:Ferredoxin n=1 Tax=Sporobacter termitidis DSM 10068 TaxID=1123282 RepID=A0A1M5XT25_9FIRM|nr:EFR1 family ferrodoxin [Sporobacter termitidis]SHI02926.1 Ferredoxin [Sporobacter termitidis DSM 10068]
MKKAIIYVFTGTGNTRRAADFIAQALSGFQIDAAVWEARVPLNTAPDPNGFDCALFGYPIHAFNTPRFFLQFVKTLPSVRRLPAFIFRTSGEPFGANSASSRSLVRILRKKGFIPMLDRQLLMPYNIVFRYNDALAKQMYLHTRDMALVIAYRIAAGKKQALRYAPWAVLLTYLFRLQWLGAWINGPLIHADKGSCIGCGHCAAMCPLQNIRLTGGYPCFSHRCAMCMGCAFRCPKDAVRLGLLDGWRVNGEYPFEKLAADDGVPPTYIDENTAGYFRLFRPYYERTYREIAAVKTELAKAAPAAAGRRTEAPR